METQVMGPVQALKEGWGLLKRHPVQLLGGSIIFLLLLIMCVKLPLPLVNWVLLLLIMFPLLGGLHVLFLKAARDTNPRLVDLFTGFRQFEKWTVSGWALVCVYFLRLVFWLFILGYGCLMLRECFPSAALPKILTAFLWGGIYVSGVMILPSFGYVLIPALAYAAFIDYGFTLFAAADNFDLHPSFARSQELAKDRKSRLFFTVLPMAFVCPGILLVIGYMVHQSNANAFGLPGWVAYALGVTVATVLALCAITATYVRLDQSTPQSQEIQGSPAPKNAAIGSKSRRLIFANIVLAFLILVILATIAVPGFVSARKSSRTRTCVQNLIRIEKAKEQWAIDNKKGTTDTPRMCDLVPKYLTSTPACPDGGGYTVGDMSADPTCSVGYDGDRDYFHHVLPRR